MTENGMFGFEKKVARMFAIPLIPRDKTLDHIVKIEVGLFAVVQCRKKSVEDIFYTTDKVKLFGR